MFQHKFWRQVIIIIVVIAILFALWVVFRSDIEKGAIRFFADIPNFVRGG